MAQKGKGKGKKKGKGNPKKTKKRAPDKNSDSILKSKIISHILSWLPVKTLLRFRRVCKQWWKIISKTDFIATHFRHSSFLPLIGSPLIIQSYSDHPALVRYKHKLRQLEELKYPYPSYSLPLSMVGPVYGILCIFRPDFGDVLTLWNPAMNMSRKVMLSKTKIPKNLVHVSVGLAFDSQKNDLLILRIFCVRPLTEIVLPKVIFEVCPMKSLSGWEEVRNDFRFYIERNTCDEIFKGEPYWLGYINPNFTIRKYKVLLRFNVSNMLLHWYPLPYVGEEDYNMKLTNFEYSIGLLSWEGENSSYVDVWEGNIEESEWNMKCRVQLRSIERILGCLRNGDIVTENGEGELVFYDSAKVIFQKRRGMPLHPVTCEVSTRVALRTSVKGSHMIFDCPESLLLIEGMVPVKELNEAEYTRFLRECDDFMQTPS